MSVWSETRKLLAAGPEDDNQRYIFAVLDSLSPSDADLHKRESLYALSLRSELAGQDNVNELIEKRIMERFSAEEAERK